MPYSRLSKNSSQQATRPEDCNKTETLATSPDSPWHREDYDSDIISKTFHC